MAVRLEPSYNTRKRREEDLSYTGDLVVFGDSVESDGFFQPAARRVDKYKGGVRVLEKPRKRDVTSGEIRPTRRLRLPGDGAGR